MSKIVQFPVPSGVQRSAGHVAAQLIGKPPAHAHVVQFYDDEAFLFQTVATFLRAGLDSGEAALIIATPSHMDGILRALGNTTRERASKTDRLVLVDAEAMLARLSVGGEPSESLLTEALDRLLASLAGAGGPRPPVRAFGEMVNVLWERGQSAAAIRLEKLWTRVVAECPELSVFCGYRMRDFYKSDASSPFEEVCQLHTHVLPTERFSHGQGDSVDRLREISVLEQRARLLENEVQYRQELERALREALEHRERLESELTASFRRERDAQIAAQTSEAFNVALSRILDPLNTLLETARLLAQPPRAASDQLNVERVHATIERVQRSFGGILEMARARLSNRAESVARCERDVTAVVADAVDELRRVHPGVRFDLAARGRCFAPLDGGRFRHVVLELGQQAVVLATAGTPITIEVAEHAAEVTVRVHHRGAPLAPELTASLLDSSLARATEPSRARGMGHGLFVAHLIVTGHGGRIDVSSTLETGTIVTARLPRFR